PSYKISPSMWLLYGRSPRIPCASRLFPEPLAPTTATTSPCRMDKDRSWMTGSFVCRRPPLYWVNDIDSPLICKIGCIASSLFMHAGGVQQAAQPLSRHRKQHDHQNQHKPREQRQPPPAGRQILHTLGQNHADRGLLRGQAETQKGHAGLVQNG